MENINSRIKRMSQKIIELTQKVQDLSRNVEEKMTTPYSKVGGIRDRSQVRSVDPSSALGQVMGGNLIWNDAELNIPPYGTLVQNPTKAYNLHSHSRYAGGALDIDTLEIVDYKKNPQGKIYDEHGNLINKHVLGLRKYDPEIENDTNTNGETVAKIGNLDLVFNADTETWGASAYEIDVKKCYLVMRDENGDIMTDENGNEMKAPLWNEDYNKTCVVWDKNAQCWRIYAVYAEEVEEE